MKKKNQKRSIKNDIRKMAGWLDNVQELLPGTFTILLHPCVAPDPDSWLAGKELPYVVGKELSFQQLPTKIIALLDNAQVALSGGRPVMSFAETGHPHQLILHSYGMNGNKLTKAIFSIHVIFKPEPKPLKVPLMVPGGELVHAI
ncbi:TPA: hypothetical protein JG871_003955 [Enterobacter hormaechei subsp. xiangfangensis]|nr:hypothetical protein [Enterobacter hormaechei subsp. xiangfangensis]